MVSFESICHSQHGAQFLGGAALPFLSRLRNALIPHDAGSAGTRIAGDSALARLLADKQGLGATAQTLGGSTVRPVRAILFDKSPKQNWALGWHQDRTICVASQIDTPGFGPWTRKQGLLHVQPPFALIEQMITIRIHLDDVAETSAPLLVALGSHRYGQVHEREVLALALRSERIACLAQAGDIWAYSTPILHASERSQNTARRRVLQVDYSAEVLPNGLEWVGV